MLGTATREKGGSQEKQGLTELPSKLQKKLQTLAWRVNLELDVQKS